MNQKHIPYFDFYPADFMHGVRGLSAQEVGVYMMVLCRIYEENGLIEFHVLRLATYCGMRQSTFEKTFRKLVDLGKFQVVDGMISNSRAETEISSRADKLKLNSKAGKASSKKRQQKQQNVSTDVQRTFNHTDTDTDKVKREGKPSPKKATRLPDDWQLPKDYGEWAVSQGWPESAIRFEADKFKDYWISKSGKDAAKINWLATWRNWLRNSKTPKLTQISGGRHEPTSKTDRLRGIISAAARGSSGQDWG